MLCCIFSSENSTESKSLTRMCIVGDSDDISRRVVADAMDSWNLTTTNVINAKHVWGSLVKSPLVLTVKTLNNLLCESDSCTTWSIEFMNVVCLDHVYVILWELVHNLCKILVHGREDGNANAEV